MKKHILQAGPSLNTIDALKWLSYCKLWGGFQWNNSPRGSSLGASVSNNLTLNNTIKIDVQDIFSRLDFLAKMKMLM